MSSETSIVVAIVIVIVDLYSAQSQSQVCNALKRRVVNSERKIGFEVFKAVYGESESFR